MGSHKVHALPTLMLKNQIAVNSSTCGWKITRQTLTCCCAIKLRFSCSSSFEIQSRSSMVSHLAFLGRSVK